MANINPRFGVGSEQGLRRNAHCRLAELLLQLPGRHAELAVKRVHLPPVTVGDHVAANRERVKTHRVVLIRQRSHCCGTKNPFLAVHRGQDVVEVRPSHDFAHGLLDRVKPFLDWAVLHQARVWSTKLEPR